MRLALVVLVLAIASPAARAEPTGGAVALLPLDADQRLEIYGQPVATEVARALVAGGIDVVVVGPKMAVPERARLVVDGTITAKGDTVVLAVRVRDRAAGTVLETLSSTAPALTNIDAAATDLSARVLPAVKLRLEALVHRPSEPPPPPPPVAPPAPAEPTAFPMEIRGEEVLAPALRKASAPWASAHHHAMTRVDQPPADGLSLQVLGYTVEPGIVPLARARVRFRIYAGGQLAFDRIVRTDTIVGDKGLAPDALALRVAREVLAIADPHVRRAIATWR